LSKTQFKAVVAAPGIMWNCSESCILKIKKCVNMELEIERRCSIIFEEIDKRLKECEEQISKKVDKTFIEEYVKTEINKRMEEIRKIQQLK
jgi:hypothetical protein